MRATVVLPSARCPSFSETCKEVARETSEVWLRRGCGWSLTRPIPWPELLRGCRWWEANSEGARLLLVPVWPPCVVVALCRWCDDECDVGPAGKADGPPRRVWVLPCVDDFPRWWEWWLVAKATLATLSTNASRADTDFKACLFRYNTWGASPDTSFRRGSSPRLLCNGFPRRFIAWREL